MALIDTYLNEIRTAVYGREVRTAIINGIQECYNYVSEQIGSITSETLTAYVTYDGLSDDYYSKSETLDNFVLKTDLEDYLSIDQGDDRYILKSSLNQYQTASDISDVYATKQLLTSTYLSKADASTLYVSKEYLTSENFITIADLENYSTTIENDNKYAKLSDIEGIVKYNDLLSYPTLTYLSNNYASLDDLHTFHQFRYVICENLSASIPKNVSNYQDKVGSLEASANTMYAIYLVQVRETPGDLYDEYLTIQTDNESYYWEKIGGGSSNSEESASNVNEIDLSGYITYDEASTTYATKSELGAYLNATTASETYATKAQVTEMLGGLSNVADLATKSDLQAYLKSGVAEELYATKTDLLLYLKSADIQAIYATKNYVDTQILTAPTADNVLVMLEVDNIPGATENYYYNSSTGELSHIIHVKDGVNYRVDTFDFGENQITETRILTTGHKLIIVTNTETLETITTFETV